MARSQSFKIRSFRRLVAINPNIVPHLSLAKEGWSIHMGSAVSRLSQCRSAWQKRNNTNNRLAC